MKILTQILNLARQLDRVTDDGLVQVTPGHKLWRHGLKLHVAGGVVRVGSRKAKSY